MNPVMLNLKMTAVISQTNISFELLDQCITLSLTLTLKTAIFNLDIVAESAVDAAFMFVLSLFWRNPGENNPYSGHFFSNRPSIDPERDLEFNEKDLFGKVTRYICEQTPSRNISHVTTAMLLLLCDEGLAIETLCGKSLL